MELKWHTIFTSTDAEKKVSAILSRKNILHVCPASIASRHTKKRKQGQPFDSYLFVFIAGSQLDDILKIQGVKNFMYWMQKPALISEPEINLIIKFLEKHPQVTIEKREVGFSADWAQTYPVQKDNEAKLIQFNNNKVKAAIPSLGLLMVAEYENPAIRFNSSAPANTEVKFKIPYKMAK